MALSIAAEIQLDSEPTSLAFGNDRLFVGLENGQIKSLSSSLEDASSWPAPGPVAALATGGGAVFAAAGGVRGWADSGQVLDLPTTASDVTSLFYYKDTLYVGDETGGVRLYSNGESKAEYNVLEEVKGLAVSGSLMFTARDIDVTFTLINPDDSRVRFMTQHTTEGRAPLILAGDKLIFSSRCGRKLLVNSISCSDGFKKFSEVHASELILLALSADAESNDIWSSGWDGIVKRWRLGEDGKLTGAGELTVGACVNALLALPGVVYVAVSGGRLLKINA